MKTSMPYTQISNKIRTLGIDPGVATTGYGIIETHGMETHWVAHGTINTPAKTPLPDRLLKIHEQLSLLCKKYKPQAAGVEEIFFAKNTKTAIQVAQARGCILLGLKLEKLPCYEFTPRQVKQTLTSYGQADKKQMQMMVKLLLKLQHEPQPDDAADALAIAICTAQYISTPIYQISQ